MEDESEIDGTVQNREPTDDPDQFAFVRNVDLGVLFDCEQIDHFDQRVLALHDRVVFGHQVTCRHLCLIREELFQRIEILHERDALQLLEEVGHAVLEKQIGRNFAYQVSRLIEDSGRHFIVLHHQIGHF